MNYQDESEFNRLLDLFRKLVPRSRILEIGSLHGETLRHWMESAEIKSTIVSIDLMVPPSDPRYRIQKDGHQVNWPLDALKYGNHLFFCLDEDSKDPHTIATVNRLLLPRIDFLFIDGGHDRGTCQADWENYGPLVRPGGMVAFHDLGREWPDVRGVWEEARKGKVSQEIVVSPDQYGIGVLWK
jgi:hypothetical protein